MFSSLVSDTEVCEVVKDSRLLSRPEASPELKFCQVPGVMPEIAKWILTRTRARRVFLVSLLCPARSRLLVTEVGESVEQQNVCFRLNSEQCVQLSTESFSNVSKGVEQTNKPKMISGSWQGWQSWSASNGSWNEQQSEGANWTRAGSEQKDLIGSERIPGVNIIGRTGPIFKDSTWNEDEESKTRLVFNVKDKHHSPLTRTQSADEQSDSAEKRSARRNLCPRKN